MSRVLGQQLWSVVRVPLRWLRRALRILLLAFGCAGPPLPAPEIRGRTPAVQHESGARKQ